MPDNTAPADPITALAAGAASMHEIYLAFVAAGFTADQSMEFVLALWTEQIRQGLSDGGAS